MSSAFEKRVKRRVIARPHTFFAVCPPGLTQTCQRELSALGEDIQEISPLAGGVQFTGKLAAGYRANLCLASPSRILMR
ncbi:MAG: THUMP domain-containing protein, partial [Desulfobacterales bacterium]|nr:THUMP domain-containing protein [Desulfobacterales bacterium]